MGNDVAVRHVPPTNDPPHVGWCSRARGYWYRPTRDGRTLICTPLTAADAPDPVAYERMRRDAVGGGEAGWCEWWGIRLQIGPHVRLYCDSAGYHYLWGLPPPPRAAGTAPLRVAVPERIPVTEVGRLLCDLRRRAASPLRREGAFHFDDPAAAAAWMDGPAEEEDAPRGGAAPRVRFSLPLRRDRAFAFDDETAAMAWLDEPEVEEEAAPHRCRPRRRAAWRDPRRG